MTEEQQKEQETPTAEQEDAPETVVTDKLDDTPAVAQISDEAAETLDTDTQEIHPEAESDTQAAETETAEAGTAEAETAETPEAAAEAETEEDDSALDKAADAVSEAVETVTETVSDAVETASESVSEAVETATEAVTGSDEEEAASASDEEGSLLESAVDQAVSEMEVPTADASELIIGGVREPITSIQGAQSLDQTHVGYTGEIVGRVVKLEDLDATLEAEATSTNYDQLRALIEETLTDVSEHEIVKGRVVSVGEKDVVIDIGFKSDGVVSKNEFSRELVAGDEVEVYLERIEDYHGQLVLSKTKADTFRRWERVENAYENEEVLEGTIIRRIKGGMIVELMDGLEAFLPGSQIDVRPVRDFDAYLDKRMEFKIVKINPSNENVVVSHKALIEKELEAQRESILSTMEAGQILEGVVKNITDFGVFIDLGGVDGLLHITDLSWGRVSHPSELVDLDEQMKVVVLDYDKERQRISLGLKQLQPHPWENINERFSEGDVVEGKVVSITDYGAFVELEKGIEGLVHISEMSWTDHIRHPSQKVSLGQLVNVKILNIDNEGKKISLGMKQLEDNPWTGLTERYPPGTVLRGKVRNITNFGVFVEIEPGIDGLVHISDLSWTKKIRHPGEMIKKGQDLSVVILDIDEDRQRVSLGHKQIETNPWNDFANVYAEGTDHEAKIVEVDDKGLVVELGLDVQAFVPSSELKNGPDNFQSHYHEGQELELRVIRFDVSQKDIVLSETAKDRAEEYASRQAEKREKREERQREDRVVRDFQEKAASGPTTLGELSGLADLKAQMEAAEQAVEEAPAAEAEPEEPAAAEAESEETPEAEADADVELDNEAETATDEEPVAAVNPSESVAETEDIMDAKAEAEEALAEEETEAKAEEAADEEPEAEAEEEPEAQAETEEAEAEPAAEAEEEPEAEAETEEVEAEAEEEPEAEAEPVAEAEEETEAEAEEAEAPEEPEATAEAEEEVEEEPEKEEA